MTFPVSCRNSLSQSDERNLKVMSEEPLEQDTDFDRDFWRGHARRALQEAFDALQMDAFILAIGNAYS